MDEMGMAPHPDDHQAPPPQRSGNGFFGVNLGVNGERSRLFRQPNAGSKPVREWYV